MESLAFEWLNAIYPLSDVFSHHCTVIAYMLLYQTDAETVNLIVRRLIEQSSIAYCRWTTVHTIGNCRFTGEKISWKRWATGVLVGEVFNCESGWQRRECCCWTKRYWLVTLHTSVAGLFSCNHTSAMYRIRLATTCYAGISPHGHGSKLLSDARIEVYIYLVYI